MSAARDFTPLPPILGDADWAVDFTYYGADETAPLNFPDGSTFSIVLAPEGQAKPAAADVHELTSGAGITQPSGNVVAAAHAKAAHAGWTPGWYAVEKRRFGAGGAIEGLYVGRVCYARGLSQLAALGGGDLSGVVGQGSVNVFRDADQVRIVRGESASAVADATTQAQLAANYAQKTDDYAAAADNSAKSWALGGAGNGQPAAGSAKDWAQKVGAAVVAGLYSAKEWAIGTFTRGQAGGGSAKDWATYNGGAVDDAGYSARAHASGVAPTGSAKDWATKTAAEVVGGQGYGALKYAQDAAGSAGAAAGSAGAAAGSAGAAAGSAGTALAALAAINSPIAINAAGTAVAKTWEGLTSTGGSFVRNLPAAPAANDWVRFSDVARACTANPVTVGRNGNTIEGLAEDLVLDVDGDDYALLWTGATWTIL